MYAESLAELIRRRQPRIKYKLISSAGWRRYIPSLVNLSGQHSGSSKPSVAARKVIMATITAFATAATGSTFVQIRW